MFKLQLQLFNFLVPVSIRSSIGWRHQCILSCSISNYPDYASSFPESLIKPAPARLYIGYMIFEFRLCLCRGSGVQDSAKRSRIASPRKNGILLYDRSPLFVSDCTCLRDLCWNVWSYYETLVLSLKCLVDVLETLTASHQQMLSC